MSHEHITSDEQLRCYCEELAKADSIALDTEFVSEDTYHPQLCLIQVASGGRFAVIDAMAVSDVTPFWEVVVRPGHRTIMHAGRGELEFCLRAVGRGPANLFDVQMAAGLVGCEYPAGYATLLGKILGEKASKGETRTDWRRRPLSDRQIEYALDDVRYLHPLYETLSRRLAELGRAGWLEDELEAWQESVEESLNGERWRRVSGSSGLDRRGLAIVRELWRWRETTAAGRNCPRRRVLRDDLIVELARRKTADAKRIGAVRGMQRRDLHSILPQLSQCIERALAMPEEKRPGRLRSKHSPQLPVLGQFLSAALSCICRQAELAPALVGNPSDVRDFVAYRTGQGKHSPDEPPQLATGWRAELVGKTLDDLLAGKTAIHIADPASEHPLVFKPTDPESRPEPD